MLLTRHNATNFILINLVKSKLGLIFHRNDIFSKIRFNLNAFINLGYIKLGKRIPTFNHFVKLLLMVIGDFVGNWSEISNEVEYYIHF